MVFEIWNEIGNLIDDQKNLINSLNDISIKGNVGISYVLEWFIKWRIENRLGMNGNSDRYTVLNWMKSGIESLYIIILTQFIPLFSLFFSYFSILFFFFSKPSGRTSSIFPRPHQAISRCERKLSRSICSCSGRSDVCGSSKFIFANKGKRKEGNMIEWSHDPFWKHCFECFKKQRDSKKFEFSLNWPSYYIYEHRFIFLTKN